MTEDVWFAVSVLVMVAIPAAVAVGYAVDELGLKIPGQRPITKALFVAGFLFGAIPYLLGYLLAWAVRKPEVKP